MKLSSYFATTLATLFIAGCMASYPVTPEGQASHHVTQAKAGYAKGNLHFAFGHADSALDKTTGGSKLREWFDAEPGAQKAYVSSIEAEIHNPSHSAWSLEILEEKMLKLKASGALPVAATDSLQRDFDALIGRSILDGSIPLDLGSKISQRKEFQGSAYKQALFRNSLKNLRDQNDSDTTLPALLKYVESQGPRSAEWKMLEAQLPDLNVKRKDLDTVSLLFPKFAEQRKASITVKAVLEVKADRLLYDDIKQLLAKKTNQGVIWTDSSDQQAITVSVERIRHDEKVKPESTQTITYAQHEVNLLGAALLMPQNASYLYELVSGGAEIDYGYVVSAYRKGIKIHDQVVRGRVGGDYARCQNPRIQNVFGGVSSAGFVANEDMERRCSTTRTVSMDRLRAEVQEKITEEILRVSPIKTARELN
ncbi:hypothetical protein [Azovibrio restrictus]|uniref:hypothetical protein n=1 Tax=Azovibrio restrictus TaxID=146938 RepID=UPI0004000AE6|nr:hypothetical protein [Azovibrio restrictus]